MKIVSPRISLAIVLLCSTSACRKHTAAGVSEANVTPTATPRATTGLKLRRLNHPATDIPRVSDFARNENTAAGLGGPMEVGTDSQNGEVLLELLAEVAQQWRCQDVEAFKREFPRELALLACYGGQDEAEARMRAATSFRCGINSCPASIIFTRTGGALRVELGASIRQGGSTDSMLGSTDSNSTGISLRVFVQRPTRDAVENCVAYDRMPGWGLYVEEARQAVDQICRNPATPHP